MRDQPRARGRTVPPRRHGAYDWRDHVPRNSDTRLGGATLLATGLIT